MAHSLSWIDPETLRTLVSETAYRRVQAERPAPSPPVDVRRPESTPAPPRNPEPDPSPPPVVRMSEPAPVVRSQTASRSVRRATRPSLPDPDAQAAPPVPAPPVRASVYDPFRPPPGAALEECLEALMIWACRSTGLARAFIADADGLLVAAHNIGEQAVDDAVFIVELCGRAVPREIAEADAGTVTMVAAERTHVVAWELTPHGKSYIALSGTAEPPPEAVANLSQALRDALR